MKPIFVFNPEHDLALANGDRHYIPPKNIREMARDLAPLMDAALASSPWGVTSLDTGGCNLQPWGWNSSVVEHFKKRGISPKMLPADDALASLSRRSERATAHHLLSAFRAAHPSDWYVGESMLMRHVADIRDYAERHGHILLKAPLSGSGKGLRHVNVDDSENEDESQNKNEKTLRGNDDENRHLSLKKVESWASALIQRHGYLTAEPFYAKAVDFAMEFCADALGCHFIGYSLFNTDHHGRYIESRLMSDEAIEEVLMRYISEESLREVCRWVIVYCDDIIPAEWDTVRHPLYFGIDMMVVAEGSSFKLHPCVEVNLRLNMGIIAHELYRHRLAPEARGIFRLAFFPDTQALHTFSTEQSCLHPAAYLEERLVRGYLPLTPIAEGTRHHAYILCE